MASKHFCTILLRVTLLIGANIPTGLFSVEIYVDKVLSVDIVVDIKQQNISTLRHEKKYNPQGVGR